MKKYITYLFCLLSGLSLLAGCRKDEAGDTDNPAFRIALPAGAPDTAFPRREVSFDIEVFAKAGLKKVEIRKDFQLVEGSVQEFDGKASSGTYHFAFTANRFDIGKKFNFVVAAYDQEGYTSTATYSVTIKEAPVNITMSIPEEAPDTLRLLSETVSFPLPVVSELPLTSITTSLNGVVLDSLTQTSFANPLSDVYDFHYAPSELDAGQELVFTFTATDAEEKVKTAEYVLYVKGERPPQPVKTYSTAMGGQLSTDNGHFLNSATGSVHFRTGVAAISETIDLLSFVSGASTGVNITAPSFKNAEIIYSTANSGPDAMVSWPVRNATQLIRLSTVTAADFEAITMDNEIVQLFEGGGATSDNVNRILAGHIIVFKTVKGKHGLILIREIPASNRGSILMDVKMQP